LKQKQLNGKHKTELLIKLKLYPSNQHSKIRKHVFQYSCTFWKYR